MTLLLMEVSPFPCYFLLQNPNIQPVFKYPQSLFSPQNERPNFTPRNIGVSNILSVKVFYVCSYKKLITATKLVL
jgi:hypothetical protein